jgi:hypothetical protein
MLFRIQIARNIVSANAKANANVYLKSESPLAKNCDKRKQGICCKIFSFSQLIFLLALMKIINQGEFERSDVTEKIFSICLHTFYAHLKGRCHENYILSKSLLK